jgi:exopolysaccharide biosynthesis polyprenyl glycosylphosphotransferase
MPWPLTVAAALLFVIGNIALQLCLMSFSRLVIKLLASYDKTIGLTDAMTQRAIVVGTGENARNVADMVASSPELDTRLVGFLDFHRQGYWRYHDVPLIGHPDSLESIVANSQVDALFWAVEPEDISRSWRFMETAEKMGVRIFVMPNLYRPKVARVRPTYINGLPAMIYRSEPESPVPLLFKSIMDRLGAGIGLVLATPIMLLVAAIVKFDSRGPIFFKQIRLGLNGKPFTLFKFRTMCGDAETRKTNLMAHNEMTGPVFKIKRDPRVTKVGRFLRKFSIDELPQLFNIIKGEMSLVGPRPPLPQEVSRFEPWQHRKLSVKPGLTCLWQVNGRNNIDFEEWMKLDLQYIDNWSLWLDAKILAKTVPTVVKGSGQ